MTTEEHLDGRKAMGLPKFLNNTDLNFNIDQSFLGFGNHIFVVVFDK